MYVNQSSVSVWKPRSNQLTSHLPESTHWIKKQATHIRLLSTRTLDEFVTKSSQKKKKIERGKKRADSGSQLLLFPDFYLLLLFILKAQGGASPDISPQ